MRPFIWQKIRGWHIGCARTSSKNLFKNAKKSFFLAPFLGIFLNISKAITYVILCLALHHWWKFCTNWTWFGLVIYQKPPKSSQKSYFLLIQDTLKLNNLTTRNAIPMKLTRIVYLRETFHFPKNWGVTHTAKEGVVQKLLKPTTKWSFWANFFEFSAPYQKP